MSIQQVQMSSMDRAHYNNKYLGNNNSPSDPGLNLPHNTMKKSNIHCVNTKPIKCKSLIVYEMFNGVEN